MLRTLTLVVAAVILPSLHAFNFEPQPEDAMLDEWMQEQMTEGVWPNLPDPSGPAGRQEGVWIAAIIIPFYLA